MIDYTDMTVLTEDAASRLGCYVLNLSAIAATLGHASPIGTVRTYIAPDDAVLDPMYWVALDIFRGADQDARDGSTPEVAEARARIRKFVASIGYIDLVAAAAVR